MSEKVFVVYFFLMSAQMWTGVTMLANDEKVKIVGRINCLLCVFLSIVFQFLPN